MTTIDPTLSQFLSSCEEPELIPYIHLHTDFFTSLDFMEQLKQIFLSSPELRPKISTLLQRWVILRFKKDFYKNKPLMDQILEFGSLLDKHTPLTGFSYQNKFKLSFIQGVNNIKKSRQERISQYIGIDEFRKEMLESEGGQGFRFTLMLNCDPIANQLLLIDWDYLQSIESYELVSNTWKRIPDSSVRKYVRYFNKLAHFVASKILAEEDSDVREKIATRFIVLADDCREKRNYNGLMAILAGLNLHPVSRLKKLWSKIPKRSLETKEKLDQLMDPRSNYKSYRAALASQTSSHSVVIPYFGIYLRDLLFIEEGNPVKTETGEMNRDRITLLAGVLKEIQAMQKQSLKKVDRDDQLASFLENVTGCSESLLDKLSFANEGSRSGSMLLDTEITRSSSSSSIASNESK